MVINKKILKRIIIISVAVILVAAFSVGSVFIAAEVNRDKFDKYIQTIPFKNGEIDFSSWTKNDEYKADDYPIVNAEGSAKILLFTDIHFGNLEDFSGNLNIYIKRDKKILSDIENAVKTQKPDLLIFLGDVIVSRDSEEKMTEFGSFIDNLGVPWTYIFGNHEGDGSLYNTERDFWLRADKAYLAGMLSKFDNSLYRNGYSVKFDDNLYSIGNDMIRVNIDGKQVYSLFTMDSNSYFLPSYDYDGVRPTQVDWYNWAAKNNGTPNMVFMHMPIPQYKNAFESVDKKLNGVQPLDTGMFDKMLANKCTDIYSGHLHGLEDDILYQGINFRFAMTSSIKALYGKKAGYKSITINPDSSVEVQKNIF